MTFQQLLAWPRASALPFISVWGEMRPARQQAGQAPASEGSRVLGKPIQQTLIQPLMVLGTILGIPGVVWLWAATPALPLTAVWPREDRPSAPSLGFLICSMGTTVPPPCRRCGCEK